MTDFDFQVDNFMLYCSAKNLSKKTLASYEQTLKLLGKYLEQEHNINEVAKIQAGHIRHYIKFLQERGKYTVNHQEMAAINLPEKRKDFGKKISDTTIANYLRNIKVFFNYLHNIEEEIKKNPCDKVANIKPKRKMKKTLTPEEIKRVLGTFDASTFHGYRNYLITKALLDTGMRIGECLNLKPEHLDFKHKSILIVDPKNKKQRYVYFSHKLSLELKRWMQFKDRYSESVFLFPTIRGTQLQIRNAEKALREAGKKVDVEIQCHQLRNNFAKYYIFNGGDWFTLSRILGHSSVEVTQKAYLDFTDDEVRKKYQMHSPLGHMNI